MQSSSEKDMQRIRGLLSFPSQQQRQGSSCTAGECTAREEGGNENNKSGKSSAVEKGRNDGKIMDVDLEDVSEEEEEDLVLEEAFGRQQQRNPPTKKTDSLITSLLSCEMASLDPAWKWVLSFCLVDFLNRMVFGAFGTMLYPAQPYIAANLGVSIEAVTLIWSLSGIGWFLGTVASALTFKQRLRSCRAKMGFFFAASVAIGVLSVAFPFTTSYSLFLFLNVSRSFLCAAWETAGAGMLVYTVGPIRSRSLIMCHHFVVGLGFLLGPVLISPFLPEGAAEEKQRDEACQTNSHNGTINDSNNDVEVVSMASMSWPFVLVFVGHVALGLGYLALISVPWTMPVYSESQPSGSTPASKTSKSAEESKNELWAKVVIAVFFTVSCGSERLFQTIEFLFAMCGPLALPARRAVVTDECYNGGFMVGRFLSMFVVDRVPPRRMLQLSTTACLVSSIAVALKADDSAFVLFACALVFGFAVSWQFGAAYSWASEHIDVAGSGGMVFHIGCTVGGSSSAFLSGFTFENAGNPMAVWYINVLFTSVQVSSYLALSFLFDKNKPNASSSQDVAYSKLRQNDEVMLLSASDENE